MMKNTLITGVVAGLSCLFAYGSADAFGVSYEFVGVEGTRGSMAAVW
jgi:hypothetical protein